MRGFAKVSVLGNVGKDPEVRYTQQGQPVVSFSVAATETWTKDGEKKERTEWVNVTCFGKLGEIARDYVKKGSPVYIEGKFQTEKYEKDGQTRYSTKVVLGGFDAKLVLLPDGKGKAEGVRERAAGATETFLQGQAAGGGEFQATDDDVPF